MPLDGPPVNGNARLAGMPASAEPQADRQIDTAAPATADAASGPAEQATPEQAGPVPPSAARLGLETAAPELGAVEPGPQPPRVRPSRSGRRADGAHAMRPSGRRRRRQRW